MKNTIGLSIAAGIAVAILAAGIATTVISGTNSAYAWGNNGNKKQSKVVLENKCANIGDDNRDIDIHNIICRIEHTAINCAIGSTCVIGKLD